MHELSIAKNLITEVLDALPVDCRAEDVRVIHLNIGPLSGVVPEALDFAFQAIRQDTSFSEARLEIHVSTQCWRCRDCSHEVRSDIPPTACPACGSTDQILFGSHELTIDRLEVL